MLLKSLLLRLRAVVSISSLKKTFTSPPTISTVVTVFLLRFLLTFLGLTFLQAASLYIVIIREGFFYLLSIYTLSNAFRLTPLFFEDTGRYFKQTLGYFSPLFALMVADLVALFAFFLLL